MNINLAAGRLPSTMVAMAVQDEGERAGPGGRDDGNRFKPRDYGLTSGAAGAVLGVLLYLVAEPFPDVLWRDDTTATAALVGVSALLGATLSAAAMRKRTLLAEMAAAIAMAIVIYGSVQSASLYIVTAPGRDARAASADWTTVVQTDYRGESRSLEVPSKFGSSRLFVRDGRHTVSVTSSRDVTQPVPLIYETPSPALADFYLEFSVRQDVGPSTSFCGVMLAYEKPELWWAVMVNNRRLLTVTQNAGGLPHRYVHDAEGIKPLWPTKANRLGVLKSGGQLTVFLNDRRVVRLRDLKIANGSLRLAAQSKNQPVEVRCSFSDVLLRGVVPG